MTRTYFSFMLTGREIKLLSLTILLAICGALGLDIHLASLPHIMLDLHTDKHSMQQSVTLYMLGAAFSVLIYGPLSDKLGRKPVVLFGLALFCITSFFTHCEFTNILSVKKFAIFCIAIWCHLIQSS